MSSRRGGAKAASYGRTGQLFTVTSLISVYTTLTCKFLLHNELLLYDELLLYNELLRRLDRGIYIESAAVIGDIPDGSQSEGRGGTFSAAIMAANSHVAAAAAAAGL
jgi:hypothetical protein